MNKKQRGHVLIVGIVLLALVLMPLKLIFVILISIAVVFIVTAGIYWYQDGNLDKFWESI